MQVLVDRVEQPCATQLRQSDDVGIIRMALCANLPGPLIHLTIVYIDGSTCEKELLKPSLRRRLCEFAPDLSSNGQLPPSVPKPVEEGFSGFTPVRTKYVVRPVRIHNGTHHSDPDGPRGLIKKEAPICARSIENIPVLVDTQRVNGDIQTIAFEEQDRNILGR